MNKIEMIEGFNIPFIELAPEEANLEIDLDRFKLFHFDVGEDFVDSFHVDHYEFLIFSGYVMATRPELASSVLKLCSNPSSEPLTLKYLYEENDLTEDDFYTDFAAFLNLTDKLRQRVNQVLIQVANHYDD